MHTFVSVLGSFVLTLYRKPAIIPCFSFEGSFSAPRCRTCVVIGRCNRKFNRLNVRLKYLLRARRLFNASCVATGRRQSILYTIYILYTLYYTLHYTIHYTTLYHTLDYTNYTILYYTMLYHTGPDRRRRPRAAASKSAWRDRPRRRRPCYVLIVHTVHRIPAQAYFVVLSMLYVQQTINHNTS